MPFSAYMIQYMIHFVLQVLRHGKVKTAYSIFFPFHSSFFLDLIIFPLFGFILIKENKFIMGQEPVQQKHLTPCALQPSKKVKLFFCTVFVFPAYTDHHCTLQIRFCSRSNSFQSSTPSTLPHSFVQLCSFPFRLD